jgi:hypothetical protein
MAVECFAIVAISVVAGVVSDLAGGNHDAGLFAALVAGGGLAIVLTFRWRRG